MSGSRDPTDADRSRRDLCVELEVVHEAAAACPLAGIDGEVVGVRQRLVDRTCRTDVTVRTSGSGGDASVVHATSEVDGGCPCAVFDAVGCVPEVTDVSDDRFRVEAYLPDRTALGELIDALESVTAEVHLCRIRRVDGAADDPGETVTVELAGLTEKQREAAVRAVASGYYERPRETSFGELADDLGVSKPALSQRLSAVEAKLATAAFVDAD
ncbi:helix-turn-helix domain-containing protein [Halomicrobium salinisoli]|uniref:helix-turn-helix domain-containing protein n=1 Tax=Halomicrobium salinisoli TaxID=2878391 RepID=UPI001CF04644|nr:helix-turn-helix domain-containing protein [Halomicrobium salinisoli]